MIESLVAIRNGLFQTFVRIEGEGDPLLFLHGISGIQGWPPFLENLARSFPRHRCDHPGFGRSEGWNTWTMSSTWRCIPSSLRPWGWSNHTWWAIRSGGMIAAEVAAIAPDVASKLVLIAPLGLWLDDHGAGLLRGHAGRTGDGDVPRPGSDIAKELMTLPSDSEALEAVLERTRNLSAAGNFSGPSPIKG
jgi:pimeloyl-ACP methyl ester carboxylesterase